MKRNIGKEVIGTVLKRSREEELGERKMRGGARTQDEMRSPEEELGEREGEEEPGHRMR